jgi:hypothetical protein
MWVAGGNDGLAGVEMEDIRTYRFWSIFWKVCSAWEKKS